MKRRILLVAGLLLVAAFTLYYAELASSQRDYFLERVGSVREAELVATSVSDGRYETFHVQSTSGLDIDMRVVRPLQTGQKKLPVFLLVGGHRTGKDAVELVGCTENAAFAAIDYPYDGPDSVDGLWQSLATVADIQQAFVDAPPAIMLAIEFLLQQPWVDETQVELVGVSLGVPFAAAAGALDKRLSRVWLMHGGAENVSWVMHAGRRSIENESARRLAARTLLFFVYGRSLDARDWIPEIAPRPLIIVAARNDDYVPLEAQQPFIDAAQSEHVELIWTEGQHIRPKREEELGQLLDIISERVQTGETGTRSP